MTLWCLSLQEHSYLQNRCLVRYQVRTKALLCTCSVMQQSIPFANPLMLYAVHCIYLCIICNATSVKASDVCKVPTACTKSKTWQVIHFSTRLFELCTQHFSHLYNESSVNVLFQPFPTSFISFVLINLAKCKSPIASLGDRALPVWGYVSNYLCRCWLCL